MAAEKRADKSASICATGGKTRIILGTITAAITAESNKKSTDRYGKRGMTTYCFVIRRH
jgi:hypothetical protein